MIFNVKTHFKSYLLQLFCTFMNTKQHILYMKKCLGAITKSLAFHCYTIYTLIRLHVLFWRLAGSVSSYAQQMDPRE